MLRTRICLAAMGISQHVHGTDNARCLIALALITGQVGRPGTGLHPLRGQNNVQGASDAGLIPMFLPDYQPVGRDDMRLGERPSHYAMILIASLVTGFISMRQVSLHLAPGDPGYGSTLLGLHFYTWALIAAVGIVCYVALVFVLKDVTDDRDGAVPLNGPASNAVFAIFAVLVAANLLSTVLECGAGQCDDNPVRYLLLK